MGSVTSSAVRLLPALALILVTAGAAQAAGVPAQTANESEKLLIRTSKPYGSVVTRIQSLGGRVTYQYKYVDAIAAELPRSALSGLRDIVSVGAITKDAIIALPRSVDTERGRKLVSQLAERDLVAEQAQALGAKELQAFAGAGPNGYLVNLGYANVSGLHAAGFTGLGVIVGVIDSGIRPGFPHISLDGSVVGCVDLVGDALGCSNFSNGGHGTFVAGMISANVVFTFSTGSSLRNAVLAECPACFLDPPTKTQIPMLGTAPLSSIYAFRVFPPTGGAPTSRILAAVERVIDLRQKFDAGDPAGVNIQVVNMSLGGSTVFAGRDLFDTAVDMLLSNGIVPVISAGNAGPSSMTVGSPGTSVSAITVGAASLPHNERIYRRLLYGPVGGPLYRPFLGVQTSYFSSRGPDASGHSDPDVTASGFASYGQGFSSSTNGITIGSGTSFAAPSVAGVAALLRQAFPSATARQIRNAIIATANPSLLSDGSTALDQGAGYVDGAAAAAMLASGTVPDTLPSLPNSQKSVKVNVEQGSALRVRDGFVSEKAASLKPGQRHDILYRVAPNTSQVVIMLGNVMPALPPASQNQLFGDDILLAVHSAKTSAIGEGDYPIFEFTTGGTFVVNNPETGIMRITVNGDWTNAGEISADVSVLSVTDPVPQFSEEGKIAYGRILAFPVKVPADTQQLAARLGWREDWGNYPSADVDMILVSPSGATDDAGATLSNPESALVSNPEPGDWVILVYGFEVHTATDKFELRVSIDGKVMKLK